MGEYKRVSAINMVMILVGAILVSVAVSQYFSLGFFGMVVVGGVGGILALSTILGIGGTVSDVFERSLGKSKRRVCPVCGSILKRIIQRGEYFWYCQNCSSKVEVPTTLRRRERLMEERRSRRGI